jgi:DNA-binding IclR family transcriptional regulator
VAKSFDILLELPHGDDARSDRQFVTALARGLEILRTFGPEDGPLGNQELAERTGLPKPTVSRITHTLTMLGYLEYVPRMAKYTLGPAVLSLGHSNAGVLGIRSIATPHMQELAEVVDGAVALGARDRLKMIYLDLCRGSRTVALRLDIGAQVPIHRSAMGMAYLSALPDKEQGFLLDAIKRADPADWFETRARIEAAFVEIERDGFCVAAGAFERSVNGVGAPLILRDRGQVYALNCSAPAFEFTEERLRTEIGPRLATAADAIAGDIRRQSRPH